MRDPDRNDIYSRGKDIFTGISVGPKDLDGWER